MPINYFKLIKTARNIYEQEGPETTHATHQAENIVSGEAKGIWSHDISLLSRHLEDISTDKTNFHLQFTTQENSPLLL